jgi:hypothetical protein
VSEVRLFLNGQPRQGRLRVRLVELLAGPPACPGIHDLLPTPSVFTHEQLAQVRKGLLVLAVSAANLLLPAAGLCVVVKCLPTSGQDFPLLTAGRGAGAGTWSYYADRPVCTARSAVSYTVRTEMRLLSY